MLKDVRKAQEQLQGVWIMEIGEMAGLRKAEVEAAKSFLSAQQDEYRKAYGMEMGYYKRQVVPFGTSNIRGLLKKSGGNRRFWTLDIAVQAPKLSVWDDLTPSMINQIWAEAVEYYREGERLFLPEALERVAAEEQAAHEENDDRNGIILKYLDMKLPAVWYGMSVIERRTYFEGMDEQTVPGTLQRDSVSAAEIWCEVFGKPQAEMTSHNTRFIHELLRDHPDYVEMPGRSVQRLYGKQTIYGFYGENMPESDILIDL